jgi:hypothetical protein
MSKTLEEIQAEIAAQAAAAKAPAPVVAENAPAPKPLSVTELLEQLAAATNIPIDRMLGALDAAAPDQPELLPEGAKVYYTSFPNCGIMVQRGSIAERIEFKGDRLVTTDPEVIAYLDPIADKPGSTIYTKSKEHVSVEVQQMREDLMAAAKKSHTRMTAAGERVA